MNLETSKSQWHINSLDFIKICATFAIIFHHYQQYLEVKYKHINFFFGAFPFHSMVFLFFCISGFFMARYIEAIKNKGIDFDLFIKKRAFRLLPMTALTAILYEVVLIIFVVITGTTFHKVTTEMGYSGMGVINGFSMLLSMTGTGSGWFWRGAIANESTWFICVLMLCYITFYLCCRFSGHYVFKVRYAFAIVIMIGLGVASYGIQLPFLNSRSFEGYIPFFIGVLLGDFMDKRNNTAKGIVLKFGLLGLTISIIYIVGMIYFTRNAFTDNYWLMFVTFPSLIIVFLAEPVKKVFRHRIWQIWGGVTFDAYVWHFICIILLIAFNKGFELNLPIGSRLFMIAFSAFIFLIGVISYFFIEGKMGRLVKNIGERLKNTQCNL